MSAHAQEVDHELIVVARRRGIVPSFNSGASVAAGRWLALVEGDTEVSDGWLTSLLSSASNRAGTAIVTPRVLDADGRLHQAGVIIRADARLHSYGAGEDPAHFRYGFRREVDCGSGAVLLVKRELWSTLGGLDEAYASADHAVADLCLACRELGQKVVYEPTTAAVRSVGPSGSVGSVGSVGSPLSSARRRLQHRASALHGRLLLLSRWATQLRADASLDQCPKRRADRATGPHALLVGDRVPTGDSDADPTLELLEALHRLGSRVTFLPEDLNGVQPTTTRLERLGIEVVHGALDLEMELPQLAGDVRLIILSGSGPSDRWTGRLRALAPQATIVHTVPDLHWLRAASPERAHPDRTAAHPAGTAVAAAVLGEADTRRMQTADLILVATAQDAELLEAGRVDTPVSCLDALDSCLRELLGRTQDSTGAAARGRSSSSS